MAHESDDRWVPDPRTLEWVLAVIDEESVGRLVKAQLASAPHLLTDVTDAQLGEAAVECVIFRSIDMAREARNTAGPVHGAKVSST